MLDFTGIKQAIFQFLAYIELDKYLLKWGQADAGFLVLLQQSKILIEEECSKCLFELRWFLLSNMQFISHLLGSAGVSIFFAVDNKVVSYNCSLLAVANFLSFNDI